MVDMLIASLPSAVCVLLGMNHLIAKLLSNVIVVILNYFASKFWIFRRRDS